MTDTIDTKALIGAMRNAAAHSRNYAESKPDLGRMELEHIAGLVGFVERAADRLAALEEERDAAQAEARELREARDVWRRMAAQRLTELQHWQRGFAELAQLLPAESQVVEKPAHFSQPAAEPSTKRESLPLISQATYERLWLSEDHACELMEGSHLVVNRVSYRIADTDEHGLPVIPREPGMPEGAKYRWRIKGFRDWRYEDCLRADWHQIVSAEFQRIEDFHESQRGQEG